MNLSAIVSKYSNYKLVLLAIKLILILWEKDSRVPTVLSPNQRQLLATLNYHLNQMIKNAGMISDVHLAETHALEDFERNNLVDPCQEMDVVSTIKQDGQASIL